ncbi:MAG: SagB/ThcOx family dehydrogenase [Bacteroidales bacterium]|nr:SagB/ThcOx family dehydrogenase [Bacteroidales bacterium]
MKYIILFSFPLMLLFSNCINAQDEKTKFQQETYMHHKILNVILLPQPDFEGELSVESALHSRRSVREYRASPLTLEEISQILWAAYGITKPDNVREFLRGGMKTAPSAGARYPLEIYLVAINVTGLTPGIYLYRPQGHQLLKLFEGDVRDELANATYSADVVKRAPACLVYSAVYKRTTEKYGDRGRERYVCMDVGFSAENVYLQARSLNIGTVMVGSVIDDKVRKVIKMSEEETPMCFMPLGKMK